MPVTLDGRYELGRTLGYGVSCKVKIARDSSRRYAIKIMNGDCDWQSCIDGETELLANLQHRHIVRLVEVGQGPKVNPRRGSKIVKFIVLELVGGGELYDFVALGGRLSEP